jgi:hypothetical protein
LSSSAAQTADALDTERVGELPGTRRVRKDGWLDDDAELLDYVASARGHPPPPCERDERRVPLRNGGLRFGLRFRFGLTG